MEITYVTTNTGKVISLRRYLEPLGVEVIQHSLELPEPRSFNVTLIAEQKAKFAYKELKRPVVTLDSGFYISSLNGFPGAYVNPTLETIGLEGILKLVRGEKRDCEFRKCLAYMDAKTLGAVCFNSSFRGTLCEEPRGKLQKHHWSKLAQIFIPPLSTMTLAEMTPEEYAQSIKNSSKEIPCEKQFSDWYFRRITK